MLELKAITKTYKKNKEPTLTNINLQFNRHEFVAILGPSGSGKSTLLNIIGGLDRSDGGTFLINGKDVKTFKETDYDRYRHDMVGFIFQNCNLINHLTVIDNVMMPLLLESRNHQTSYQLALAMLTKVGLEALIMKKPNELSGGEKQRVAIARALVTNPAIILADEPTGSLDTKTSVQIMDLIKQLSSDKLVIMVTHNMNLATKYATRLILLADGQVKSDSKAPSLLISETNHYHKVRLSFLGALKLSFNNLLSKFKRTIITSLAASIGIIGMALVLALSNGFKLELKRLEKESLSSLPIVINQEVTITAATNNQTYGDDLIRPLSSETTIHYNHFTDEYLRYIEAIDSADLAGVNLVKATHLNLYTKGSVVTAFDEANLILLPDNSHLDSYDLVAGKIATNYDEVMIIIDAHNNLNKAILTAFNLETCSYDTILKQELKLIFNDDFYQKQGSYYTVSDSLESLYDNDHNLTLKIVGVLRGKADNLVASTDNGLAYLSSLTDYVISLNHHSKIVSDQLVSDYNLLDGSKLTSKTALLTYLGYETTPSAIYLYPSSYKAKTSILTYLDAYNDSHAESNLYTDMAKQITSLSGNIMNVITTILLAFSSISLLVSSIMIGIITYISVLERTSEIGILRSLGARKRDISLVFKAETFITGLLAGLLGIMVTLVLIYPINLLIDHYLGLKGVAILSPVAGLFLLILSIALTMIGGLIPAHLAAKKDPIQSIRVE